MFLNRGETGRYIPKYGMIARQDPKKRFLMAIPDTKSDIETR